LDLLAELMALVASLDRHRVEYAICGGIALAIHGVPRATQDIDLLAQETDLEPLRTAARECGFVFESEPMEFHQSSVTIVRFTKLVGVLPLMLDVLLAKGPTKRVWDGRQEILFEGTRVKVVTREGLITLKLAAARPQDMVDIQKLTEVNRG
jgi:predicted nucleotidyltransferase